MPPARAGNDLGLPRTVSRSQSVFVGKRRQFAVVPYAALAASCGLDFEPYPKAQAWLNRMLARDSVKKTLAAAREAA